MLANAGQIIVENQKDKLNGNSSGKNPGADYVFD